LEPINIGFLASHGGSNMQAVLDANQQKELYANPRVLISNNSKSMALERARTFGMPYYHISNRTHPGPDQVDTTILNTLRKHEVEYVILVGYMKKLGPKTLNEFKSRIINIHPSLLPAFPGAHAVSDALAHGVKVTGTTVHLVSDDLDGGPIIAQRAVPVRDDDDEDALHDRIKALEHEILPAVVKLLCHGRLDVEGRHVRIRPAADATALTILDVDSEGDAVHGR
jgi:phosphoribosylglycinamide formyltransferase 1